VTNKGCRHAHHIRYDSIMASTRDHARAKHLRSNPTDAERALWRLLRRQVLGARFRRQHPVPPYVADFACIEARLVVEVDGGWHGGASDAARDTAMIAAGWRVLRFWNDQVLRESEAVLGTIKAALDKR
jgi:primosomal protein N' (replication factor Y)